MKHLWTVALVLLGVVLGIALGVIAGLIIARLLT